MRLQFEGSLQSNNVLSSYRQQVSHIMHKDKDKIAVKWNVRNMAQGVPRVLLFHDRSYSFSFHINELPDRVKYTRVFFDTIPLW